MKLLPLLILLTSLLNASNLLTYNIYERSDRVDVMLSFDAPYEGKIFQKKEDLKVILTLEDLVFNENIKKNLQSHIVQLLEIVPEGSKTVITLSSENEFNIIASKTVDGFGLRVRAKEHATLEEKPQTILPKQAVVPKSSEPIVTSRYIAVVAILFILLLTLLWIKRRVKKTTKSSSLAWLGDAYKDFKIVRQKALDAQNKVILIEYGNTQYLVLTGNSNVLLDKFGDTKVENEGDFNAIFEQNRQKIDEYLQVNQNRLGSYKQRASQDVTLLG
ncbi:MAG: hypothetical protein M0P02_00150 [Sulfurospirillaceae bacterium]|nr:hypothetical protein [Sulfurospirillaceae bacterium]MCK9545327.1 hypothetical protein [Sulfurospirillaceae bacterium]